MTLPEVRSVPIPGFTITWSSEYDEYPTEFSIDVKNGDTVVNSVTVTDNTSSVTEVALEVSDYDSVVLTVSDWSIPDHRVRIDRISFGHVISFGKNDILSYSHEQYGDLNSAELPKNTIEFTVDNVDGRWNPSNPTGVEKYLSERQEVNVRYGYLINGVVEWIKAGRFYLSEWRAPSNGIEAYFVARDALEFAINTPCEETASNRLGPIINDALLNTDFINYGEYKIGIMLRFTDATFPSDKEYTVAEIVQMCANAGKCVIYQDREGVLNIVPHDSSLTDYIISSDVTYSHPEMELSKPLKAVSVSYGTEGTYTLSVGTSGETQTVTNPMVSTETQAEDIAEWVRDTLQSRKTVSGEFRADPRLDLFDVVTVESKYGTISPVAITSIKYTYNGAFLGTYTGRVLTEG
jgi:hypothetical protein